MPSPSPAPLLLLALGAAYWLFLSPLARTVQRVIAIARDPLHRATPETGWELFDRVVWLRLAPMWLFWALLLFAACMAGPLLYILLAPWVDTYPLFFFYALLFPAHLAGSWAMAFAGIIFWAPRLGSAGLKAWVTLTVLGAQAAIAGGAWLLLARSARLGAPGKEVWVSFALVTLFTGLAAALGSWTRARTAGEAWFGLDENEPRARGRRR